MMTWHANESPEDVAFFCVFNTSFDDVNFERFLGIHVGDGSENDVVGGRVQAQAPNGSRLDQS